MSTKTRDISDYLDDIATAINEAEEFTSNMTYETFASDRKTVNAVIRSLEVLGEATKRIPASFRQKHARHSVEQNGWHAGRTHPRLHGC
jgi:uncharacterized protein with HEPN domain